MYVNNKNVSHIEVLNEVKRNKVVKKFTSTTANYDLLSVTNIRDAIKDLGYSEEQLTAGLNMTVTVICDTVTQVKINTENFYNDLIEDTLYDRTSIITNVIIADNAVSGTLEVVINE